MSRRGISIAVIGIALVLAMLLGIHRLQRTVDRSRHQDLANWYGFVIGQAPPPGYKWGTYRPPGLVRPWDRVFIIEDAKRHITSLALTFGECRRRLNPEGDERLCGPGSSAMLAARNSADGIQVLRETVGRLGPPTAQDGILGGTKDARANAYFTWNFMWPAMRCNGRTPILKPPPPEPTRTLGRVDLEIRSDQVRLSITAYDRVMQELGQTEISLAVHRCRNPSRSMPKEPATPEKHWIPRNDHSKWLTQSDYPKSARRAAHEGVVRVELSVGKNGQVTNCRVSSSSGDAALDKTTCRLLRQRARFKPADPEIAKPQPGMVKQAVRWQLED